MFESSKLRSNVTITGIAQPVVALVIYAIVWALYGITWGLVSLGMIFGIYAVLSLAYLFRTGNRRLRLPVFTRPLSSAFCHVSLPQLEPSPLNSAAG